MKASMLKKTLLSLTLTIMFCFSVVSSYAQSDPSKEILVYFSQGIEKSSAGLPVYISSTAIQKLLTHFNIKKEQLTSAFPNFKEADTLVMSPEGRQIKQANLGKIFRMLVPAGISRKDVIDSLRNTPGVLFAEENGTATPNVVPNDQYFSYQWSLQAGGGTGKIQAPEAWDIYKGSSSSIIGIIDYGVDGSHPDLTGKVTGDAPGSVFHGTHVAGISAAKTNNTTGVSGINWNAQILSKSIDGLDYTGIYQKIVDAVNYSTNVQVLNNSWGLLPYGNYSTTVRLAFAYAYKMNRTAIVAMGNNNGSQTQYPAGFGQGIIAVGATDQNDAVAGFSDIGNHIDVSAPGVHILSTYRNGVTFSDPNYEYLDGTSMAAPEVTGIASLLKGYNSNLSNDDIEHIIQLSADDITTYPATTGWDQYTGYGRVNAKNALNLLRSPYVFNQLSATGGTDYATTNYYTMTIYGANGLVDGTYMVKRHEVRKNVSYSPLANPSVWGRGVTTTGWSADNANFAMGFCEVVPGTITYNSAVLRTYVYEVYTMFFGWVGWYPTTPANVQFAYTTLGTPQPPFSVSIFGPEYLGFKEMGNWTANVVGGSGNVNYQWYISFNNGSNWTTLGTSQSQSYRMINVNFIIRCDVHDNGTGENASAQQNVYYGTPPPIAFGDDGGQLVREIPQNYNLDQNYPNPFNPTTQIKYALKEDGLVTIKVYDILGKVVATLVDENKPAGFYTVNFDASRLSSGIYLYTIKAGNFFDTKKMLLVK